MLDFEMYRSDADRAIETITRTKGRALAGIDSRKRQEQISLDARFQLEVDQVTTNFQKDIDSAEETYQRLSAVAIYDHLTADYRMLVERDKLCGISEDVIKTAKRIKETFDEISDEPTRSKTFETAKEGFSEDVRMALDFLSSNLMTRRKVTSYTAVSPSGVYVLIPSDGMNRGLVYDLESRLLEIVNQGELDLREKEDRRLDVKSGAVVGDNSGLIHFELGSMDIYNGFTLYFVTTHSRSESERLEQGLIKKLSKTPSEPDGFSQAKLEHSVISVDFKIIQYFKSHDISLESPLCQIEKMLAQGKTSMTYDEVSKMTGKDIKCIKANITRGLLEQLGGGQVSIQSLKMYLQGANAGYSNSATNETRNKSKPQPYSSSDPNEIKREAYSRLDEIIAQGKNTISGKDLCYILGLSIANGPSSTAKRPEMRPFVEVVKEGNRQKFYFKVDGIKNLLDHSERDKRGGWIYTPPNQ